MDRVHRFKCFCQGKVVSVRSVFPFQNLSVANVKHPSARQVSRRTGVAIRILFQALDQLILCLRRDNNFVYEKHALGLLKLHRYFSEKYVLIIFTLLPLHVKALGLPGDKYWIK